jgi:hypothetical protein
MGETIKEFLENVLDKDKDWWYNSI